MPKVRSKTNNKREETALRVSKSFRDKLKIISAFEGRTLMSITTAAFEEAIALYESETGVVLRARHGRPFVGALSLNRNNFVKKTR